MGVNMCNKIPYYEKQLAMISAVVIENKEQGEQGTTRRQVNYHKIRKIHGYPDSHVKNVHTCQVIQLRQVVQQLA